MKSILIAVIIVAGGLILAGCQSSDTNNGPQPSSVGNGQTRNNGPFAPDSSPPAGAATQPSSHY
jgi:hypothetical protein